MILANFINTSAVRLLAVGAILACGSVFAGETLTIQNGAATQTYTTAGDIVNAPANVIVGNWMIMAVAGSNNDSASSPDLLLTYQAEALKANPGNLVIDFTVDGMTANPLLVSESDSGINHGTTSSFTTLYAPPANTLIPALSYTAVGIAGQMGFSNGISPTVEIFPSATPFSLSLDTTIAPLAIPSKGGPRSIQVTDQLFGQSTPEPSFYALTGFGLAGLLAVTAARRRNKRQPTA